MQTITLLKLGGSLITDKTKPFTARLSVIDNLSNQIAHALHRMRNVHLIIGNGGGSFPHYPAVEYQMTNGIHNKEQVMGFCKVQDAAARLNRIIVASLIKAGVPAVSVHPSSMIVCRNKVVKRFNIDPIVELLNIGVVPVLYGDIVVDTLQGATILSTEQLLAILAVRFRKRGFDISKIIQNGATPGVLDQNNNVIPSIKPKDISQIKKVIRKTEGFDVTGGMWHKIEESMRLARKGIPTVIINGAFDQKILQKAILGETVQGTYITA